MNPHFTDPIFHGFLNVVISFMFLLTLRILIREREFLAEQQGAFCVFLPDYNT